jgi:hypothetical protein
VEEKESSVLDIENNEVYCLYNGQIFSSDILLLSSKDIFKFNSEKKINSKGKKHSLLGVYKLMSINIEQQDLKYNEYYLNKFKKISNESTSDENKAKELDELFKKIGLAIPKKIFVGGLYSENSSNSNLNKAYKNNFDYTYDENILKQTTNNTFSQFIKNKERLIIGGDISKNGFKEWRESINLNNSAIIEYSNLIEARDLLDDELQRKLKIPFQLLIDRRKNRKLYLNEIINNNLIEVSGYKDKKIGKCEEIKNCKYPEIYKKAFKVYTPAAYIGYYTENFSKKFDDIIVGVNIIDNRKDDYNGQWTFKNNPLLSKEIDIIFVSCFDRAQKYTVEVYLLKRIN